MTGQLVLMPPAPPSDHPVDVGQRTEAIVLAELVKRGHRVLIPFGHNHRYDLVLDLGDEFARVQCKTARIAEGCVTFSCQSVRSNTKQVVYRDYRGDADLFIAYCPQNDRVYAVPVDEAALTRVCLRLDPPANNQKLGVRWATDYELPACTPGQDGDLDSAYPPE